jgi:uncharacterized membrane protein
MYPRVPGGISSGSGRIVSRQELIAIARRGGVDADTLNRQLQEDMRSGRAIPVGQDRVQLDYSGYRGGGYPGGEDHGYPGDGYEGGDGSTTQRPTQRF